MTHPFIVSMHHFLFLAKKTFFRDKNPNHRSVEILFRIIHVKSANCVEGQVSRIILAISVNKRKQNVSIKSRICLIFRLNLYVQINNEECSIILNLFFRDDKECDLNWSRRVHFHFRRRTSRKKWI